MQMCKCCFQAHAICINAHYIDYWYHRCPQSAFIPRTFTLPSSEGTELSTVMWPAPQIKNKENLFPLKKLIFSIQAFKSDAIKSTRFGFFKTYETI